MRIIKRHTLLKPATDYVIDSPQPSNISYWWNIGSLLGLSLMIQIITGITLAMHYNPNVLEAFNSVEHIMRDVNNGWLIRYLHSNTASAFFFLVYLHIGRGLYYGSYKAPRSLTWTLGTIIFITMMATAFLGYVLPYGQMSLWGATVITNLMSAIPWIGQDIVEFVWGGFSVNNATLNRFFSLHFVLPFIIAALVLMHLIALHDSAGSNNPLGVSGNYDRVAFAPYFIFKDIITIFIFMWVLSLFVFFIPNVLGDSENYVMANPMQTPPAIVPEWYLLPFYAILRSIPNKLIGVIAMFSAILIILTMTFGDLAKLRGIQFKPLNKTVFFIFVGNLLLLMVLGAKHVESPFIEIGQIATLVYFIYFIVIVPMGTMFENSINEFYTNKTKLTLKQAGLIPFNKLNRIVLLLPVLAIEYGILIFMFKASIGESGNLSYTIVFLSIIFMSIIRTLIYSLSSKLGKQEITVKKKQAIIFFFSSLFISCFIFVAFRLILGYFPCFSYIEYFSILFLGSFMSLSDLLGISSIAKAFSIVLSGEHNKAKMTIGEVKSLSVVKQINKSNLPTTLYYDEQGNVGSSKQHASEQSHSAPTQSRNSSPGLFVTDSPITSRPVSPMWDEYTNITAIEAERVKEAKQVELHRQKMQLIQAKEARQIELARQTLQLTQSGDRPFRYSLPQQAFEFGKVQSYINHYKSVSYLNGIAKPENDQLTLVKIEERKDWLKKKADADILCNIKYSQFKTALNDRLEGKINDEQLELSKFFYETAWADLHNLTKTCNSMFTIADKSKLKDIDWLTNQQTFAQDMISKKDLSGKANGRDIFPDYKSLNYELRKHYNNLLLEILYSNTDVKGQIRSKVNRNFLSPSVREYLIDLNNHKILTDNKGGFSAWHTNNLIEKIKKIQE